MRASTGFKAKLLPVWPSIFANGAIFFYGNPIPSNANAAPGAAPIAVVTNEGLPWSPHNNGWGLRFLFDGQYIRGDPRQAWQIMPNDSAAGVPAVWWRMVAPGDDGLPSLTAPRLDGRIGLLSAPDGEEILLASLLLTPRQPVPLSSFFYTIPPLPGA